MDGSLFQSINRFAARTDWAHGFMRFYANRGVVVFAVLLVGYLLARSRSDLSGVAGSLWAGGAALIALGLAQIIGNVVDRGRPYETLANVHVLVDKTTDFSFPSDHATLVGAVAVGLFFVDRWLGLAAGSPQSSWRSRASTSARTIPAMSSPDWRWAESSHGSVTSSSCRCCAA